MCVRLIILASMIVICNGKLLKLTCNQIKEFVDGHNIRRLQLVKGNVTGQPRATNMKLLVWDEEIAKKAENWAKRNTFQHNPDTTLPSKRFETGENLYMFRTTDRKQHSIKLEVGIESWFEEHKHFRYKKLDMKDFRGSYDIGHYTQMVWGDTSHIGCAISQYQDGKWNTFIMVCNYAPRGNTLSLKPYETTGKGRVGLLCTEKKICEKKYGSHCS